MAKLFRINTYKKHGGEGVLSLTTNPRKECYPIAQEESRKNQSRVTSHQSPVTSRQSHLLTASSADPYPPARRSEGSPWHRNRPSPRPATSSAPIASAISARIETGAPSSIAPAAL